MLFVSILVPLTGDKLIPKTIDSIVSQGYEKCEIILLRNDICDLPGNVDVLENRPLLFESGLEIREIMIRERGKGNALNIGIKRAKGNVIAVVDADCVLEDNSLIAVVKHFDNDNVSAVGGRLLVMKDDGSILEQAQKFVYRDTFQLVRSIFARINGQCLISGAFGMFRKSALISIGGYDSDTVGEDMEIVLRLQDNNGKRSNNKVVYEKNAICKTGVPHSIKRLFRQRERWQRGLKDCLIKHRNMIGNPRYGMLGMAMLYQLIFELYGPIVLPLFSVAMYGICWMCGFEISIISMMLAHLGVNLGINVLGIFLENRRNLLFVWRLPRLLLITVVIVIGQIPLNIVRIYGMVFFKKRRLIW